MCVVRSCFRFPPEPFSSRFYSIFPLFSVRPSRFCPFPFLRFVFICPFCSCVEFYRKRSFISLPENYRLFPLRPPCPPLPSYSHSASVRSVSPFLSVPLPSRFSSPVVRALIFPGGVFYPATARNSPIPSPSAAAILAPAVRPIPIPLLSARSRRFVRSLSEPFPLPVVRALIFPEGVFYPATGKFPRLPPFAAAILAPVVRPVLVPFLSARSRRFCPFPFRAVSPSRRRYADILSSGEICRLSRNETRRVRLPVRTDSAPVWLLGPAAPFCSPSFVLPPAFRSVVRSCRFCLPRRLYCRPGCPCSVRSFCRGTTRS